MKNKLKLLEIMQEIGSIGVINEMIFILREYGCLSHREEIENKRVLSKARDEMKKLSEKYN